MKMKIVTYSHDDISGVMNALNKIRITGIDQAKLIVYISGILDSGEIRTRHEPPGEGDKKDENT